MDNISSLTIRKVQLKKDFSKENKLNIYLCQTLLPKDPVRGESPLFITHPASEGSPDIEQFTSMLDSLPDNAHFAVFSEHPGAWASFEKIQERSKKIQQTLIIPFGKVPIGSKSRNLVGVFTEDKNFLLEKLSLSSEEQDIEGMERGKEFFIFKNNGCRWAVLNCHEYTHLDLMYMLGRYKPHLLIVTARNPASNLYFNYARADVHRFSCFIVICNIGNYGGSGIFAPYRSYGLGNISLDGTLFQTRGPSELSQLYELPLGELRRSRELYIAEKTIEEKKFDECSNQGKQRSDAYRFITPPEYYLISEPQYQRDLKVPDEYDLTREYGIKGKEKLKVQVAIAQLRSPAIDVYIRNSYRVSRDSKVGDNFINEIKRELKNLKKLKGKTLDFLVFPEVFIPEPIIKHLEKYAQKTHTVVICGIEYAPQKSSSLYGTENAEGENRCLIIIPSQKRWKKGAKFTYTKLTRSQYDAIADYNTYPPRRFTMHRGNELYRFRHPVLGSFAVLICYDYSHLDILHTISARSDEPPEILFVLSHNPDSDLYKACCIADSHRVYQYIVMCNVAEYGNSGIFGPKRTLGAKQTILNAGIGAEGILTAELDLASLRLARKQSDEILGDKGQPFQRKPGLYQTRYDNIDL